MFSTFCTYLYTNTAVTEIMTCYYTVKTGDSGFTFLIKWLSFTESSGLVVVFCKKNDRVCGISVREIVAGDSNLRSPNNTILICYYKLKQQSVVFNRDLKVTFYSFSVLSIYNKNL